MQGTSGEGRQFLQRCVVSLWARGAGDGVGVGDFFGFPLERVSKNMQNIGHLPRTRAPAGSLVFSRCRVGERTVTPPQSTALSRMTGPLGACRAESHVPSKQHAQQPALGLGRRTEARERPFHSEEMLAAVQPLKAVFRSARAPRSSKVAGAEGRVITCFSATGSRNTAPRLTLGLGRGLVGLNRPRSRPSTSNAAIAVQGPSGGVDTSDDDDKKRTLTFTEDELAQRDARAFSNFKSQEARRRLMRKPWKEMKFKEQFEYAFVRFTLVVSGLFVLLGVVASLTLSALLFSMGMREVLIDAVTAWAHYNPVARLLSQSFPGTITSSSRLASTAPAVAPRRGRNESMHVPPSNDAFDVTCAHGASLREGACGVGCGCP